MQHEAERERITRNIEEDRTELRRALRDLGLSVLLGLNLPRRIRRRPVPWTIGALGVAAFVLVRRQQRKRARRWG
ncbi:MAG TPA: hypothetical protein VMS55_18230 [Myxococcota bacterium]|nr:hypothetical protein [Myxococcota bacterium]